MPEKDYRKTGLARALSKLGYCSRSQAAEMIRAGRVQLNEKVRRDPETPASLEKDRIVVDGVAVKPPEKIYLMMNKPRGLVTTASDEKGRDTVYAALDKALPWVAPVGRLDKASEGLLLLTNDSGWSARIADPQTHLDKTYHVQINKVADDKFVQALMRGTKVDRETLSARKANLLRSGEKNCWLEVVLDEGKNRQIRRMMESLEAEVLRLIRVAIGPLALGDLAKGASRPLTTEEKAALDRAIRGSAPATKRRHP